MDKTNQDKQHNLPVSNTPFDDVFKTECVKLKQYLVPLVNELFGEEYLVEEAEVDRYANELYRVDTSEEGYEYISKRFSDSCVRINGKIYELECQSTEDGSILLRLADYNMRIAMEGAIFPKGSRKLILELPKSALVMLRSGMDGQKGSKMAIEYCHEDQKILMEIPVLHVQAYSLDEILSKKLYFLFPFYIMRLEERVKDLRKERTGVDELDPELNPELNEKNKLEAMQEYDTIRLEIERLSEQIQACCEAQDITEEDGRDFAELSRIIINYLILGLSDDMRKGLVNAMGGHIIELESDRRYKLGEVKGRREGKAEGKAEGLIEGKIIGKYEAGQPINEIAETVGKPIDFVEAVLRDNEVISI